MGRAGSMGRAGTVGLAEMGRAGMGCCNETRSEAQPRGFMLLLVFCCDFLKNVLLQFCLP